MSQRCYGCASTHSVSLDGTGLSPPVHKLTLTPHNYIVCNSTGQVSIFTLGGKEIATISTGVPTPACAYDESSDQFALTIGSAPPLVLLRSLQALLPEHPETERRIEWNQCSLEDCEGLSLVVAPLAAGNDFASQIVFCPGGQIVAGSCGEAALLFDTSSGQCLTMLCGWAPVTTMLFSSLQSEPRLITIHTDGVFVVWHVTSGKPLYRSVPRRFGTEPVGVGEDTERGILLFWCRDATLFACQAPSYQVVASLSLSDTVLQSPSSVEGQVPPPPMLVVRLGQKPSLVSADSVPAPTHAATPGTILALHAHAPFWLLAADTGLYRLDLNAREMDVVMEWTPATTYGVLRDRTVGFDVVTATPTHTHFFQVMSVDSAPSHPLDVCRNTSMQSLPPSFLKPLGPKPTPKSTAPSKPVVFHPSLKIRSSGYATDKPWSVQQQQKAKRRHTVESRPSATPAPPKYPLDGGGVISQPHTDFFAAVSAKPVHSAAVIGMAQTAECDHIASCSTDGTCVVLRTPLSKTGSGGAVVKGAGSGKAVVTCDFPAFLPHRILLTTSGEMVNFHKVGKETPLLSVSLDKEVKAARYFFMDKLVVAAKGSELVVLQTYFDTEVDDLNRAESKSNYKVAATFKVDSCQSLCCMEVYNTFCSNFIFAAGSNKSIYLIDAGAGGAVVATFPDAHTRSVHSLTLPISSRYATSLPEGYLNTFLTAACDNIVRLWDIRVGQCVRIYAGQHKNSSGPIGVAMSPCGKFVTCGSEDRSLVVYDYISGTLAGKITRMKDVATTLRYHAVRPMLYVGGSEGSLGAYIP